DHIRAEPENAGIPTEDLYERLIDRGFVRLGVRPTGRYRYTFTFEQVHAGTPQFIVGLTVGAFVVTITKADVDASGQAILDPSFPPCRLMGAVLDLKAGVGAGFSEGLGGPLVGSVTFESVAKLTPTDFQSALVKQIGVAVLKGAAGPVGGTAFQSDYVVV